MFIAANALLENWDPLLVGGLIVLIGWFFGSLAQKCHLPALTFQIILGVVLGSSVLNILGHNQLQPISNFAIGLIAMTVGSHLNFKRLHNSYKRILQIALIEGSLAFFTVFLALQYFNPFNLEDAVKIGGHLLIASIAIATSPASTLHVIKEKKAKGILVKTMVAVIAIDNLLCLAFFEIVSSYTKMQLSGISFVKLLLPSLAGFVIAIIIGACAGFALHFFAKKIQKKHYSRQISTPILFSATLIAIVLSHGICTTINTHTILNPSPLIADMILGLVLANYCQQKEHIIDQFEIMEHAVFICFFVLAGTHLDLSQISKSVFYGSIIYLSFMAIGKYIGAYAAAHFGDSTKNVAKYIGRCLLVQAGMSIALVIVLNNDPIFTDNLPIKEISAALLTSIVISELLGTVLLAKSLDQAKESGKDKTRLIDFLDEEYILPSLYSHTKMQCLEELSHFMVQTHNMEMSTEELFELVKKREEDQTTGIGEGIAVPHIILESDEITEIKGVLALADPTINYDSIDGVPVRLLIMIITPKNQEERHLEVIAAIGVLLGNKDIRTQIFNARSAAEIYEIIHSEEAEDFNYFIKG